MSKSEKKVKKTPEEKREKKERKEKKRQLAAELEQAPKKVKVSQHSKADIAAFLTKNEIIVSTLDGKVEEIDPIMTFKQANFPEQLFKDLSVFPAPTPIQSVSWPPLLAGRDLVGISKTGSGKTISFGIPGLLHIQKSVRSTRKPKVLVLSPTRELAMQIQDQFVLFSKSSNLSFVCIYGGVPKRPQQDKLARGMDCIIATPGRLIDLFEENSTLCDLSDVDYLVLDEADRMLDAGFEDAIKKIIAKLPSKGRQTVMFSATWPQSIQRMASTYLTNPIKITVGSTDLSANASIEQRVEVLDPYGKETRLLALLKDYHKDRKNRILIFALYKKEAARLETMLKRNGYNAGAIHGDLSQDSRTRALEAFKNGSSPLLIATDVAARGIDIPNVEYVINVTFPLTVEDYCHRIGRTGRAGKTGISHTFFTLHDKAHSEGGLINILKQANQAVPPELMKFGTTVKKKVDPNYGVFARDVDMSLKPTKVTFDSDSE